MISSQLEIIKQVNYSILQESLHLLCYYIPHMEVIFLPAGCAAIHGTDPQLLCCRSFTPCPG